MIILACATFSSVISMIGYVILAIICLMFMVVIHELGHYTAGRILGFKINEFGIGFGPPIFKKTSKKTGQVFSIRPIPLGGFCQFEGEDDEEENQHEGAFNNQAPWKRLIVLFSGAFCNFVSTIILITLVFTFYGQLLPTITYVAEESYIYKNSVLQEGDTILRINGDMVNILMQDDISRNLSKLAGDEGELTLLRKGKRIKVKIIKSEIFERDEDNNIKKDETGNIITKRAYGFSVGLSYASLNFFNAIGRSFSYSFYVVYKILWLIGQLLLGKLSFSQSAGGPVTVIKTIAQASMTGFGNLLYVVCLISANLAVMNLLPLPALDGSKMVFTIIEWIRGKPINRKVENIIHLTGFILLFALAIFADLVQFLV